MEYIFENLDQKHRDEVMAIFNHYVENSFAAYPEKRLPIGFFDVILEKSTGYPAFGIKNPDTGTILGFCSLKPFYPFSTFKETAEISYFIHPGEVGKGVGKQALEILENKGRAMGIKQILASISSLNESSLAFHAKHGFRECGRFLQVIKKNDIRFDIIWMQKEI